MRASFALLLIALAGVVSACGGTKIASVRDVERVFAHDGQPFQAEILPNQYLRPKQPLWPGGHRSEIEPHVLGSLGAVDSTRFSGLEAWVFDSAASARAAQRLTPGLADRKPTRIVRGNSTSTSGFVIRRGNVVVSGSEDRWHAVQKALADLR